MKNVIGTYSPAAEKALGILIIAAVCLTFIFLIFCLYKAFKEQMRNKK